MSCSNCGNGGCGGCSSGCGRIDASQIILNPVNAGTRACSPLSNTCGTSQSASPTPFYECAPQCQEDHCQQIVNNYYAPAICTQYAFNMPACGEVASVYFIDVKSLPVGAFLWDDLAGYLEVTAFNNQTGLATLLNNCNDGNAAVGTNIPACTCFTVQAPPCCAEDPQLGVFVAVDFTAPADGDCTTITVTSIAGLIEGSTISIGSGSYILDSILSPTTIVICNEGDGITPGTVVEARNEAGQLQFPVIQTGTNPCSRDPVTEGVVVVCDGEAASPLEGASDGMVLVLTDSATSTAEYVSFVTASDSDQSVLATDTLTVDEDFAETTPFTLTINNTGTTSMVVQATFGFYGIVIPLAANGIWNFDIQISENGGAYTGLLGPVFGTAAPYQIGQNLDSIFSSFTFPKLYTVAAGAILTLAVKGIMTSESAVDIGVQFFVTATASGVAV